MIDLTDLDHLPDEGECVEKPTKKPESFLEAAATYASAPCGRCGGSGVYAGFGTCFTCRGSGKSARRIRTDPAGVAARRKRRAQRQAREQAKREQAQQDRKDRLAAWADTNPAQFAWLQANKGGRSDFAASLLCAVAKYGKLTDGQAAAVDKCIAQEAERKANAPKVDNLVAVVEFFEAANTRLKFPKITLTFGDDMPLRLQMAGERSKYHGSINLTDGGPYGENIWYGRINPDGTVTLGRDGNANREALVEILTKLGEDPANIALQYGRKTGSCCFCRRDLRDPASVSAGYGPTCADKWGLPHGEIIED